MGGIIFAMALFAGAPGMLGASTVTALAQEFNLVIRNHKFEPEEIRVPAGKRVSLYVANEDSTPEEFDSADFDECWRYELINELLIVSPLSAEEEADPIGEALEQLAQLQVALRAADALALPNSVRREDTDDPILIVIRIADIAVLGLEPLDRLDILDHC